MMIFTEVAGIADCETAENDREWTRILREKKIKLPQAEAAAGVSPGKNRTTNPDV